MNIPCHLHDCSHNHFLTNIMHAHFLHPPAWPTPPHSCPTIAWGPSPWWLQWLLLLLLLYLSLVGWFGGGKKCGKSYSGSQDFPAFSAKITFLCPIHHWLHILGGYYLWRAACASGIPSVCPSLNSNRLSVRASVCPKFSLSVRNSVYLSEILSICPNFCLSVRNSVRHFVCLSVIPSVCL